MATYFFHLAGPKGLEPDDIGVDFPDPESAYLDGYRAALEISIEMLRERQDPSGLRFEICDREGALVMELHFADVLRGGRVSSAGVRTQDVRAKLQDALTRSRELKAELSAGIEQARAALVVAQATLRRDAPL